MAGDNARRLSLIRHANAEHDSDVRDFERPLSRKGRSEADEMARRFLERGLNPDLILVSAAVRTRETAEIFARILSVPARLLQAEDSLYLADGEHILAAIRAMGPRQRFTRRTGRRRDERTGDYARLANSFAGRRRDLRISRN